MRLNGKNVHPALLITLGAPYFQVLCDGLLLYGQTTAISESRYYAWIIYKIWWKVIACRIWWWDEILWQNCAPSVIDNIASQNYLVHLSTSIDWLIFCFASSLVCFNLIFWIMTNTYTFHIHLKLKIICRIKLYFPIEYNYSPRLLVPHSTFCVYHFVSQYY